MNAVMMFNGLFVSLEQTDTKLCPETAHVVFFLILLSIYCSHLRIYDLISGGGVRCSDD